MKSNNFIVNTKELLATLPKTLASNNPLSPLDTMRVVYRLTKAIGKLEAFEKQANAQFHSGDEYATFNRAFVEAFTLE